MSVLRGNMNGRNNIVSSNIDDLENVGEGFGGFGFRPEMIFEFNRGNDVDLTNLNVGDSVTAAQLTVDTTSIFEDTSTTNGRASRAVVRITFSSNLNYTITPDEQMNLLFKLYRLDDNRRRTELTSVPYTVSLTGNLNDETEIFTTELQKNETFYTEYFDELRGGGTHTYVMEVSLVYSSIDLATIQSGYISATGQINFGCRR
jgi:hypothetical protein